MEAVFTNPRLKVFVLLLVAIQLKTGESDFISQEWDLGPDSKASIKCGTLFDLLNSCFIV